MYGNAQLASESTHIFDKYQIVFKLSERDFTLDLMSIPDKSRFSEVAAKKSATAPW